MTKLKRKPKVDRFAHDPIGGEYEKPGPAMDPDAAKIAAVISEIKKREQTGVVINWRPDWAKHLNPFSFYFFDDGFALDLFNRERGGEMDALAEDLTPGQRAEVSQKTALCSENGIKYLHLGPDDELDKGQIAARLGVINFKKMAKRTSVASDGIQEEEIS